MVKKFTFVVICLDITSDALSSEIKKQCMSGCQSVSDIAEDTNELQLTRWIMEQRSYTGIEIV